MKKEKIINKIISIIIILLSISSIGMLYIIDILPIKYFVPIIIIISLIDIFIIYKLFKSKKTKIFKPISIITIIILLLSNFYTINTLNFFSNFGLTKTIHQYSIITLKEVNYELNDLENKTIGIYDGVDEYQEAIKELENKITFSKFEITDLENIIPSLENDVDAILIESNILDLLIELNPDINNQIKIIHEYNVTIYIDNKDNLDPLTETFNIYVSGADNYNNLSLNTRSDVNMIVSINPNDNEILITGIPRDYYIPVANNNHSDKLTHIGVYGIDTLTKSIEEFFEIKIDYYVKVNFDSVIEIINALGTIEVYSEYNLNISSEGNNYNIKKGMNTMDGEEALAFSRERKSLPGGDRTRIENQYNVVEGLINKVLDPSILINYTSFLESLTNSFATNAPTDIITDLIKNQLDTNANWEISSSTLNGTDANIPLSHYNNQILYVMQPDSESVNNAKFKLHEINE